MDGRTFDGALWPDQPLDGWTIGVQNVRARELGAGEARLRADERRVHRRDAPLHLPRRRQGNLSICPSLIISKLHHYTVELGRLEGERVADGVGDPVPGHGVLPGLGGLHLRRPPRRRVRSHVATQLPGKNVNTYSSKL